MGALQMVVALFSMAEWYLGSWLSKLQTTFSLSSAEAETNAAVEAVKTIVPTRLLMRELGRGPSGPTELYDDNAPAIAMVDNDGNLNRWKHFQLKVQWLKDQKQRQVFKYITALESMLDA